MSKDKIPENIPRTKTILAMSLREWYAGLAMQGIMAGKVAIHKDDCKPPYTLNIITDCAFGLADEMIKESRKQDGDKSSPTESSQANKELDNED